MGLENPALKKIIEIVRDNPNKYTYSDLAALSGLTYDQITSAIRRAKSKYILQVKIEQPGPKPETKFKPKRRHEYIPPPPNTENVLVVGDLHEPFTLEGYREFCYEQYKKYKITHVIFIGDIIDGHAWSYHEHDPDGMSPKSELDQAIENIAEWYRLFPRADSILGNHCRLFMRKATTSGLPSQVIMDMQDILGVPGWHFTEEQFYDGIHYIHGEGPTARTRARKDIVSTVQGHRHSEAYTEWIVGHAFRIFGMQVGCGVNRKAYAFAYAKNHPKPAIGVGVILNHGKEVFNVLMDL